MCKRLCVLILIAALLAGVACTRRMAPFSPHLPEDEAHRAAAGSQDCKGCHDLARLTDHKPEDNCRRCHRSLPGG